MSVHLAQVQYPPSPVNAVMSRVDVQNGIVRATPRRLKVALVAASFGKDQAPYDDPTFEVWALNAVPPLDSQRRLRADRWFEMHERKAQNADDMLWVKRCPTPIYLPPEWFHDARSAEDAPNAVCYPLDAIERAYGSYWSCSFAYQIALALYEGFTTIGLFGVELAYGTERERTVEWACVSWWMGYAEAKGVEILLPQGSLLGTSKYRYGVEYDEEKLDVEDYVARIRRFDAIRALRDGGESVGG